MSLELEREPVAAGTFYEFSKGALEEQIKKAFLHPIGPGKIPDKSEGKERKSFGYISPHAGYMYSGPVAAHTYYAMSKEKKPETIIIIGPNHTGLGPGVSLAPWKYWRTPLGKIEVDEELRDYLIANSKIIIPEYSAHLYEHSIEVQLPFIQFIYGDGVKILPIVMKEQSPRVAEALAHELLDSLTKYKRDFLIIASTDMSHYEPHSTASEKDSKAFEKIKEGDPSKFFEFIIKKEVSMCGPGGVMVLMFIRMKLGGANPILLKYATSGDVTGDREAVVGYLSAMFPIKSDI
ncbi:MAG: AmmeMemoRadiSam system protein B [Fervidicoccaceae archaeon]